MQKKHACFSALFSGCAAWPGPSGPCELGSGVPRIPCAEPPKSRKDRAVCDPGDFRLDGQVGFITGAGAGIGRATAQTCAAAGVVSNAGGGGPKPFDMPMQDFRRALDLNVFSLFRLAQLAAPKMEKAGGGAMLAIRSMSGDNTNQRMASGGASKAVASHLVPNIAFDLGPRCIRVSGIASGAPRTDALDSVLTADIECRMLTHTPIHRLGEAQDMANAAPFLCAGASSWVSGQILMVSGGGVQELG